MSSATFSPFSFMVAPVSTISTIASAKPTNGANSIEPYSLIISTPTAFSAKYFSVMFTILVAILMFGFDQSSSSSFLIPIDTLHFPICMSKSLTMSSSFSVITSSPTTPMSAEPCST